MSLKSLKIFKKIKLVAVELVEILTLSCIMFKNGQAYFKNLVVWTPQDF